MNGQEEAGPPLELVFPPFRYFSRSVRAVPACLQARPCHKLQRQENGMGEDEPGFQTLPQTLPSIGKNYVALSLPENFSHRDNTADKNTLKADLMLQ